MHNRVLGGHEKYLVIIFMRVNPTTSANVIKTGRSQTQSGFLCDLADSICQGDWIRIDHGFFSNKVMAREENSIVISVGYTCYENQQSSCRLESISQPVK